MQYRYLLKQTGASPTTYTFTRDDAGDANRTVHMYAQLGDPTGASKVWWFHVDTASPFLGLLVAGEDRNSSNQNIVRRDVTWAQGPGAEARLYINSVLTTLDPGQPYQKQSKTEQTLDVNGNLTQSKIYHFGNLTTPARTYTHSYLTGSNYTSRHIYNRTISSSVTDGTNNITLATNSYDQTSLTNRTGLREHDSANYGTGFTYRGNVTTTTRMGVTSTASYDITGMTVSATQGSTTTTVTPANNNAAPGQVTTGSLTSSYTWTSFLGLQTDTEPNNATTSLTYDAYARPSQSTSPHGAVTTYEYTNSPPTTKATTNGKWVKTTLDGLGRTIKVEKGYITLTVSTVDTEYDSCACSPVGKVKRVSQPYAPGGTVYWTTYTYDGLGRTTSIAHPGGDGTTTYSYSGAVVTWTDPAGKAKLYTSDVFGNLQVVEEVISPSNHVTEYFYNLHNQMMSVAMTRSGVTQTRTFNYDLATARLTSATNPENGTVSYTYNTDGTVATKTDAKGQQFQYSYDSYKRATEVRRYLSGGTQDVCQKVTYHYDSNPFDGQFSSNVAGRLAATRWNGGYDTSPGSGGCTTGNASTNWFVQMFSYTAAGRPTKNRLQLARGIIGNLDGIYTYDNEGKMVSYKHPDAYGMDSGGNWVAQTGQTYTYAFDFMGRPSKLTDNDATPLEWVKDIIYGGAGQMTQIKTYSGPGPSYYTEARTYNARLQLTAQGTTQYVYSASQNNGRIAQRVGGGETVNYSYDGLNRLTLAETTGPEWGLSFAYDGFGNRLSQTVTKGTAPASSVTVNGANNQIGGWTYDANGNPTFGPLGASTLTYDVDNRLVNAGGELYAYAPDNRRVWKKRTDGSEEVYFYSITGQLIGTYTPYWMYPTMIQMRRKRSEVWFGGRLVAHRDVQQGPDVVTSKTPDRLSSYVAHWPYGEERTPTSGDKEKFATYYRDSTGLDYAQNRYYASTAGRFLTADPYMASEDVDYPGSWNRYSYVEGEPINNIDPLGLFVVDTRPMYYFDCPIFLRVDAPMPLGLPWAACTTILTGSGPSFPVPFRTEPIIPRLVPPPPEPSEPPSDPSEPAEPCFAGTSIGQLFDATTMPFPFPLPDVPSIGIPGILGKIGTISKACGLLGIITILMSQNVADSGVEEQMLKKMREENKDICTVLNEMLAAAKAEGDTAKMRKIQATQKAYGCRNVRKRR